MEPTMSLFQVNHYIRLATVSCVDYNLLTNNISLS